MAERYSKNNRHPAAIAMDAWLDSPEGAAATAGAASGTYLQNRLMRAFQAGWLAADQHISASREVKP